VIDETKLLEYLKKYKPYLYDLEVEVRKVINDTGYGDVSLSCIIRSKKVFSVDFIGARKKQYLDK